MITRHKKICSLKKKYENVKKLKFFQEIKFISKQKFSHKKCDYFIIIVIII